jgi:hypothetical protein
MFAAGFMFSAAVQQTETRTAIGGKVSTHSSQDRITDNLIQLYADRLVINKEGLMYAKVEDTKSMEPLLSKNSHTVELKPDINTLRVGDIISFYEPSEGKIIAHSIVAVGYDAHGWYAKTKGYNNDFVDDWKVRPGNIKGVVVGILN